MHHDNMTNQSIMIEQNIDTITKTKTEASRAGSAQRMRRCRARRRAGFHCFTVELHRSEIDALVRRGLLSADEREDEGAVVDALGQHIEETLGPPW
jgi:hypothetical protein